MNDDNFQIIRSSLAISIQKLTELQPERHSVLLLGGMCRKSRHAVTPVEAGGQNSARFFRTAQCAAQCSAVSESERRSIRLYGFVWESDTIEMP
jgi:hypothetical protein